MVLKAWLRAEAASPVQHSELILSRRSWDWHRYPADISRLRWDLRDASRLLEVELASKIVAKFLTLQPVLTRLEKLSLNTWEYTYKEAEQLLYIQNLANLQVCRLKCSSIFQFCDSLISAHTYILGDVYLSICSYFHTLG